MSQPDDDALLARLEERARTIARPIAPLVEARASALALSVGTDRVLLASSAVLGVAPLTAVTPIPFAEPHVAGLTARRGRAIPVFYLGAILRLPVTQLSETSRLVVLAAPGEPALAVDAVSQAELPRDEELSAPPETMTAPTRALVSGVARDGAMVLDVERLLEGPLAPIDVGPWSARARRGRE